MTKRLELGLLAVVMCTLLLSAGRSFTLSSESLEMFRDKLEVLDAAKADWQTINIDP